MSEVKMSLNPEENSGCSSRTKDRYTCEFCGKHFAFRSVLFAHATVHGAARGAEAHRCDPCRRVFPRRRDLANHVRSHGWFECRACSSTFERRDAMMESARRDSGEIVYKCRICHTKGSANPRVFKIGCRSNLEIKTENPAVVEKSYSCSKCNKSFTNNYLLNFHLKICVKLQEKPVEPVKPMLRLSGRSRIIACMYCNNEFPTNNLLVAHIKSCSKLRSDTTFICQCCGDEFPIKAYLLAHMKTHKFYVCNVCDKSFTQKCHLLKHLEVFAEMPVKCGSCRGMFLHGEQLRAHIESHRQREQSVCDVCRRVFWTDDLREHYQAHMIYKCEFCDSKFSKSSLLTLHMTSHNGEKSYECEMCDGRFLNMDSLSEHIAIHTGEFECNVCGKICMDNVSFARYVIKK